MNVIVYEPSHSGHRLTYVRLMIEALKDTGASVTLVTSKHVPDTEEFRVQLQPHVADFHCEPILDPAAHRGPTGTGQMFLSALKRFNPDHVYVPYADQLAQSLGILKLLGRCKWANQMEVEALMMRGSFAYPAASIKERAKARLSWKLANLVPWTVLHHLDPLVFVALKKRGTNIPSRLKLMPDAVEPFPLLSKSQARRRLDLPQGGRTIGCTGAMDERKGIDLLIAAFCGQPRRDDDRLLLAGKQSASIRDAIEKAHKAGPDAPQIITIDRYLSNEELDTVMSALDVVCTPYPNHIGSASIAIRAAAAQRPVLGSDFGWLGYVVPRFRLGVCCRVTDKAVFQESITQILDATPLDDSPTQEEITRRFRDFHTPANFAAHWTQRLRERLGQPALPLSQWPDG